MNAAPAVSLAQVLDDPRWFLAALDGARNAFQFVFTDHETLAAQPFLDVRWNRDGLARHEVQVDALLAGAPMDLPRTQVNFLWHSGLCCSTLIARLLDLPGRNLSLSEPGVLTTLADAYHAGALPNWNTRMRACQVVLHLLGRPLEPGAAVTIKPAPAASCFLEDSLALTTGKMLFLYSDCRSFVVSLARKGEEGRFYVRRMLAAFAPTPTARNELEAAAILWHAQIATFRKHMHPDRSASLDCEIFLAAPEETLAQIDAFLGLNLGAAHIAAVPNGPLFRRNVKDPSQSFDAARRREEHDATSRELGPALDEAVVRAKSLFGNVTLPHPLSGTSP